MPQLHPLRSRKARTASCAKQLAALEEPDLAAALAHNPTPALRALEPLVALRPPKRFRLEGSAQHGELVVTDTFVVPLGGGEGHFVEDVPPAAAAAEPEESVADSVEDRGVVAMQVE